MFKISIAGQENLPRDTGYINCGFRLLVVCLDAPCLTCLRVVI
jgi:hypothetical protein